MWNTEGNFKPHQILHLLIHLRKTLSSLESALTSVSAKRTMAPAVSSMASKTRLCKPPTTPKALVFGCSRLAMHSRSIIHRCSPDLNTIAQIHSPLLVVTCSRNQIHSLRVACQKPAINCLSDIPNKLCPLLKVLLFSSCGATDKIEEAETFTTVCPGDTIEIGGGYCRSRYMPVGSLHDRPVYEKEQGTRNILLAKSVGAETERSMPALKNVV